MERFSEMSVAAAAMLLMCALGSPSAEAAQYTNPDQGYTVTYPETWNARVHVSRRGVEFRNFPPEETPEGGFVPTGGAVVIVQVFPPYDIPAFEHSRDDYSALDYLARNSTAIARASPSSGQPARVTYEDPDLRIVRTVRHVGGKVFLLSLWCLPGDPQVPAYEQVFDSVVASLFIPTPARGAAAGHTPTAGGDL